MIKSHISIPANHPHVRIIGRTAEYPPDEIRMGFPGIKIQFAYSGPAPTLLFGAYSPDCYFDIQCDDWEPVAFRLTEGRSELPIPTGPALQIPRTIEIVRRTESWQGVASYYGMKLPEGCELVPLPSPLQRRLLFIGDSVTCGEAIDRLPPNPDTSHRASNARRSFGTLLGKWLGAEVHLVSYGGRGIMRDWQGQTDVNNAPQFFTLSLPDDPTALWEHERYSPDAVVICLGANDFNSGFIDETIYTDAYLNFVEMVRKAHRESHILLAEVPLFGDTPGTNDRAKRDLLRKCLDNVCEACQSIGDNRIVVAPIGYFPGTSCDAHPVAFQHEQIALAIQDTLCRVTAWQAR